MIEKSFKNISLPITEEEYRADPALSYSILARYERSGFNELEKLFDRIETPSLTFGSAVDSLITGGEEEFNDRFMVAEYPPTPDSIITIVKDLFNENIGNFAKITDIPDDTVLNTALKFNYQNNWKPETRVRVIKEKGAAYYKLLHIATSKTLLDTKTYTDVLNTVEALKTSEATKWYFQMDNPFEDIERLYQLKFKATIDDIDYKCMADLIVIDHKAKTIQPVDLKTSSKKEWDFFKSFIDWRYDIQSRLYWRIISLNMRKDSYFKNFKLLPYKFIVVNRVTLTPLVWEFPFSNNIGSLYFGKNKQIELRDPYDIGKELYYYLTTKPKVPKEIITSGVNDLTKWLDTI